MIIKKTKGFRIEKKEHPELSDSTIKKIEQDHLKIDPQYYTKHLKCESKGYKKAKTALSKLKKYRK
jgi:hypothetical protein